MILNLAQSGFTWKKSWKAGTSQSTSFLFGRRCRGHSSRNITEMKSNGWILPSWQGCAMLWTATSTTCLNIFRPASDKNELSAKTATYTDCKWFILLQFIFTAFFFRKNARHTFCRFCPQNRGFFKFFSQTPSLQSIFTVFLSTIFMQTFIYNLSLSCFLTFLPETPQKSVSKIQCEKTTILDIG